METGPDVAILTDAAIAATNTANAVLSLTPPVIPKKRSQDEPVFSL